MRRLGIAAILAAILGPGAPDVSARPAIRPGDTYYPLAKGHKWVFSTDYSDNTELVHEVTGTEKIGDIECFIVEHKTVSAELGSRMMRKEWLAADGNGTLIHKIQRGRSEMDVAKPFYKVKHAMKKDDEWKGEA